MPLFRAASAPRSVHHHNQQQPPKSSSISGIGSSYNNNNNSSSSSSNVCYGGPLGAILSISAPGSRRDSFRHAGSLSTTAAAGGGNSLGALVSASYLSQPQASSSYFTPQSSRKQHHAAVLSKSSESVDSYDSGRGSTQGISSSSDSGAISSSAGIGRSRPGSYHGSAAAAAAAGSDVSDGSGGALDYKRLYEKEKANGDRLGAENTRLRDENEQLKRQASEQRQVDKRLSEYEAQNKSLEQVMRENEKLKAENRALARVVARLSRQ